LADFASSSTTDRPRSAIHRFLDSDLWWSFRHSPVTVGAAVVALLMISGSLLAPLIAPHDPFDPASLNLLDATNPPAWLAGGSGRFPLGTDDQGRDILSAILYGSRLSLAVGFAAVLLR
jgi:peptide/nickel transport system permease protein